MPSALKIDPREMICKKARLDPDTLPFVSSVIENKVIREFGEPRFLIPIYSIDQWSRYPFLKVHGLIPLRVGIGTARLTRARLLIPIPKTADRILKTAV